MAGPARRLGLGLATLAAGAGFFTAVTLGTAAATPSSSGILKVGSTGTLDSIDPAIADGSMPWMFEYATGANLYGYPDANGDAGAVPVPEVAKRFTVSRNGKVYRFFLRKSYRFSDGARVTARNFEYALQRALNRRLASPGGSFVDDPHGVAIVGADAVQYGKTNSIRGVEAKGYVLTIRLARPAPGLFSVLSMPFFQAASLKLPLKREVTNVNGIRSLPTAGPYAWSLNKPDHQSNIGATSTWAVCRRISCRTSKTPTGSAARSR